MTQRRFYVVTGIVGLSVLFTVPAAAHPDVEEGRRLAQRAELERAMAAFDRAEASDDLGREDLIALLEGRALVHHALGETGELDRTLVALASIAPDHRMGRAIPPDIARAFDRARERVRRPVAIVVTPEDANVRVSIANDPGTLARELRVHHRSDRGDWELTRGPSPLVVPRTGSVALWAVAVGPGGAPIATRGTETAPEEIAARAAEATPAAATEPAAGVVPHPELAPAEVARTQSTADRPAGYPALAPDRDEGASPWPFVAAGGALVAVGIAVAVILLVPGSDTQPSFPRHPL